MMSDREELQPILYSLCKYSEANIFESFKISWTLNPWPPPQEVVLNVCAINMILSYFLVLELSIFGSDWTLFLIDKKECWSVMLTSIQQCLCVISEATRKINNGNRWRGESEKQEPWTHTLQTRQCVYFGVELLSNERQKDMSNIRELAGCFQKTINSEFFTMIVLDPLAREILQDNQSRHCMKQLQNVAAHLVHKSCLCQQAVETDPSITELRFHRDPGSSILFLLSTTGQVVFEGYLQDTMLVTNYLVARDLCDDLSAAEFIKSARKCGEGNITSLILPGTKQANGLQLNTGCNASFIMGEITLSQLPRLSIVKE